MEIADVFVVNKADRAGARDAVRELDAMLELSAARDWRPPIVSTVATAGEGIVELVDALEAHRAHLDAIGGGRGTQARPRRRGAHCRDGGARRARRLRRAVPAPSSTRLPTRWPRARRIPTKRPRGCSACADCTIVAHPLALALDGAIRGDFPVPDGGIEVVGAPPTVRARSSRSRPTPSSRSTSMSLRSARRLNGTDLGAVGCASVCAVARGGDRPYACGTFDAVLAAFAVGGEPAETLERVDRLTHPRVVEASRHRTDVRVYRTVEHDAVVVLGRGLTRRWELAFEVDEGVRARGLGTRILASSRTLLPAGTPLWMQIAPGNARSMRAAISAGFRPIGAEILFI